MLLTYQRSMLMAAMAVAGSVAGVLLFDGPAIAQPEWKEVPLKDGTYRQYQATHRTDTVDIPVRPNGGEIEYMVKMKQGDSMVYSWRAVDIAAPNRLTSEFHGHTDRAPGTTGTLIFYRKGAGGTENGSLDRAVRRNPRLVPEERHGPARGGALDARRVLRGHPEPAAELTSFRPTSAGCRTAPSARRVP